MGENLWFATILEVVVGTLWIVQIVCPKSMPSLGLVVAV